MPAPIVVLHAAYGLTPGTLALAEDLRAATGREVITPDYYRGEVFTDEARGVAHRDEVGYRTLLDRVRDDLVGVPSDAAFVGLSLGASFAQRLTAERPAMSLCVLIGNTNPVRGAWPGVPVQVHHYADDPWVNSADVSDLERVVRESGATFEHVVAPGAGHLFTEPALPEHDPALTAEVVDRIARRLSA
ncbi:dienelactone hydrolase family protein [Mobilicoccus massiliensis]|uniref:dienelactone hydrolase family protein n=1 Tax=Mobilicoccus massiliensis TaxID=1522310 RepID=UPI00058F124C|nr:dienelactone hydrolase family protein [Mobilicoccus massiliensis]